MTQHPAQRSRSAESSGTSWLGLLLGVTLPSEGESVELGTKPYVMHRGILRARELLSEAQAHTAETFAFKWARRDGFDSPESRNRMRGWLLERYGDLAHASWLREHGAYPLMLDAGCGAGFSAVELFGQRLAEIRYLGVDVSAAVDVAATRFAELGLPGCFLQADLGDLPLRPESVDLVFSEGVLHHTDSTEQALKSVARLLKPGGRILFYVYRRKGPIREFTDDYVRAQLQKLAPDDAWRAVMPLTRLGRALAELKVEVEVPEDVGLLGIKAGKYDIQRLLYWHVCKMYHHPDLTLEEANGVNFDWFAPRNAHRQTPEEVRDWCREAGLEIERERVEEAGITVIARRGR